MDNDNYHSSEKMIEQILKKDREPTKLEQAIIDRYLDQIRTGQKYEEWIGQTSSYPVSQSYLRKRNRIKTTINRLDDYKNTKGHKTKVRHPSKFKRWKGVLFCDRKLHGTLSSNEDGIYFSRCIL